MSLKFNITMIVKLMYLLFLVLSLAISAQMKINLISNDLPLTLQTYVICIITILLPIDLGYLQRVFICDTWHIRFTSLCRWS